MAYMDPTAVESVLEQITRRAVKRVIETRGRVISELKA